MTKHIYYVIHGPFPWWEVVSYTEVYGSRTVLCKFKLFSDAEYFRFKLVNK